MSDGISTRMFIAGITVAILASSLISIAISMQYSFGPQGPQGTTGPKGDTGPKGEQGPIGLTPNVTIWNFSEFMIPPAYDSGWISNTTNPNVFYHALNTTDVIVLFPHEGSQNVYSSQITNDTITVYRDSSNLDWLHRVMIWKIAEP